MSFRGLALIERDGLSHPESFFLPACHITDRLPLTCVAGHGFESGFVPAFPKDCVGHFYALASNRAIAFREVLRLFLVKQAVVHRVTYVTHKTSVVMHMFSTFWG
ncbi:MAG: hypothetical protein QOJ72_2278 [Nocardioidaceae bacterium]|nr:hypothetical protein [Nocardioidaceae bacterium]